MALGPELTPSGGVGRSSIIVVATSTPIVDFGGPVGWFFVSGRMRPQLELRLASL